MKAQKNFRRNCFVDLDNIEDELNNDNSFSIEDLSDSELNDLIGEVFDPKDK